VTRVVRLAVVGAGGIGARHIQEIRANDDARLAAVVDFTAAAATLAQEAAVPLYASLDELLARDRPDGIVLATPNALHATQALACIDARVPVLVEKPIAHTLADGARIRDAAERTNVPVLVGHHRRHSPILRTACEIIASGVLGRLVGVIGSAVFCKPDAYFAEAAWRREPGGGPILINMIHEVDNLRAMLGEINAVQAFSSSAIRGFDVEDTVSISLRFANGALGTFLLSDTAACAKSWEQTARENAAYAAYPDEDCYTVIGTQGSFGVPTMRVRCYDPGTERSWYRPFVNRTVAFERKDPLAVQIAHFVAVIRGDATPLVTARDGVADLRVVEAIAEAAQTGRVVGTSERGRRRWSLTCVTSGSRTLRRPRDGGDPGARASERRGVPASAGTTVLCRKTLGSRFRGNDGALPEDAGFPLPRERRCFSGRRRRARGCRRARAWSTCAPDTAPCTIRTRSGNDLGFPARVSPAARA
jgi:predicted dehydrogenase